MLCSAVDFVGWVRKKNGDFLNNLYFERFIFFERDIGPLLAIHCDVLGSNNKEYNSTFFGCIGSISVVVVVVVVVRSIDSIMQQKMKALCFDAVLSLLCVSVYYSSISMMTAAFIIIKVDLNNIFKDILFCNLSMIVGRAGGGEFFFWLNC
jgi:hypothetical protein